jgi:hypothetical protein
MRSGFLVARIVQPNDHKVYATEQKGDPGAAIISALERCHPGGGVHMNRYMQLSDFDKPERPTRLDGYGFVVAIELCLLVDVLLVAAYLAFRAV